MFWFWECVRWVEVVLVGIMIRLFMWWLRKLFMRLVLWVVFLEVLLSRMWCLVRVVFFLMLSVKVL